MATRYIKTLRNYAFGSTWKEFREDFGSVQMAVVFAVSTTACKAVFGTPDDMKEFLSGGLEWAVSIVVGLAALVIARLLIGARSLWEADQKTIAGLRRDLEDKRKYEYLANECKKHVGDAMHHARNRPVTTETFQQWWSVGAEIVGRCGKKYLDSWDTSPVGKGAMMFTDRYEDLQAYAAKLRHVMDDMNAKAESKEIRPKD